ncbi:hypothetical protein NE237_025540 [Protea cynaroides]|uniref:Uncharacterized protein n=1 Tax=Protea cynaroides TaxID=273540 RepID=A0A9Q0JZL7_9MAGN|nr:hypothetical protein NE237_025540 [Protea cynaroides]
MKVSDFDFSEYAIMQKLLQRAARSKPRKDKEAQAHDKTGATSVGKYRNRERPRKKGTKENSDLMMSWYLSLENGKFWFPALVYNMVVCENHKVKVFYMGSLSNSNFVISYMHGPEILYFVVSERLSCPLFMKSTLCVSTNNQIQLSSQWSETEGLHFTT